MFEWMQGRTEEPALRPHHGGTHPGGGRDFFYLLCISRFIPSPSGPKVRGKDEVLAYAPRHRHCLVWGNAANSVQSARGVFNNLFNTVFPLSLTQGLDMPGGRAAGDLGFALLLRWWKPLK